MGKISKTVVFFGSGPVAAASLASLAKSFEIEAVITKPSTEHEMSSIAKNAEVFTVSSRQELNNLMEEGLFTSQVGVIVDFGIIVDQQVIDYFPLGIVNSHFSLLPRWRGADPITFSILSGDTKSGVSLMLIDKELDTGKLIAQKSLKVLEQDTTPSLTDKLVDLSSRMLKEYLPKYISGDTKPRVQPHPDRATYSRKLVKEDGIIDWSKPAKEIEREVRAFAGWPSSRTQIAKKDVIVTKSKIVKATCPNAKPGHCVVVDKRLVVVCGKGCLEIERLKPAGKKEMAGIEFARGYIR